MLMSTNWNKLAQRNGLCISYILEINQLWILCFYVQMKHFEADLMSSSRVVDSKVHRMHGHLVWVFFSDKKAKCQMLC